MTVDIEAIARSERCDAASLRVALPLLEQGYSPPFLVRYRRDELGGLEESSLWALLDALRQDQRLQSRREALLQQCRESGVADAAFRKVLLDARSQRVLDRVARRLRHEPSDPAQQLAAQLLSPPRDAPAELEAFAAEAVGSEQAEAAIAGVDRALSNRLQNDPRLLQAAVRWLAKNAKLKILEVADPHVEDPPQAKRKSSASQETVQAPPVAAAAPAPTPAPAEPAPSVATETPASSSDAAPAEPTEGAASSPEPASPESASAEPASPEPASPEPASPEPASPESASPESASAESGRPVRESSASAAEPGLTEPAAEEPTQSSATASSKGPDASNGADAAKASALSPPAAESAEKSKSTSKAKSNDKDAASKGAAKPAKPKKKKISPRQRRRRWLVSLLQPLKGKTLVPAKLSAFQTVMLGRGLRSDVVHCTFQYDPQAMLEQLQQTAEGFNRSRGEQLRNLVREHEAKIREAAESAWWDELVDQAATRLVRVAADHLRRQMLREPIDARVVLSIDAVGPKTAAVAVVGADGRLLHTEDIPCQLSAAMRQQTVTRLGELVHQFHVDLIVVSNGPARRTSLVVLGELLEQSQPGSLRWTLAERSGADLYANGPSGNREMRSTPRRFRAATWLAFQALMPASALTKVEPTKLRLGSFQRELSDNALAEALGDVLISGVSNDGVDTNGADHAWLARLPGMTEAVAEAIHRRRRKRLFSSRAELNELPEWPDDVARNQAIGFLRVFLSEQPLDGTLIHPNDYPLAEKLATSLEIPLPPNQPPGYQPPDEEDAEKASGDGEEPAAREARGETAAEPAADTTAEQAEAPAAAAEAAEEPAAEAGEDAPTAEASVAEETTPTETPAPIAKPSAADEQAIAETLSSSSGETASSTETANASDAAASEAMPVEGTEGPEKPSSEDAAAETESSGTSEDVTALKSFREPPDESSESPSDPTPTPPQVPEPYRHPLPAQEKISKLAKEWQIGPHRARQIVHWLCDPFTSGSSPAIAARAAVMQRVPKLSELNEGEQVAGVVVGVAPFGVFVELGPDCNGLIHVSRLSESYVEDLHEVVQVGDVVVAWVTGVDAKRRRVALSAVAPEREAELAEQRKQHRGERRRGGGHPGGARGGQRGSAGGGRSSSGSGSGGGRGAAGGRRREGGKAPRGHDGGKSRDQGPRVYTKVSKSKAEPPPLTEAMQKGDEPLRTFGDLMQFFQKEKQEKPGKQKKGEDAPPVEPDAPAADNAASSRAPDSSAAAAPSSVDSPASKPPESASPAPDQDSDAPTKPSNESSTEGS